jgi:hypothetical protein
MEVSTIFESRIAAMTAIGAPSISSVRFRTFFQHADANNPGLTLRQTGYSLAQHQQQNILRAEGGLGTKFRRHS